MQGRAERGPWLLLLLLLLSSLRSLWTLAPARLGELLPPLSPVARAYSSIGLVMLGARQSAPDLAARACGPVYGFVGRVYLSPRARSVLLSCGAFINRARPGGWAGGRSVAEGGRPPWGGAAARMRCRLAGDQSDRSKAQGAPCRTYRLFYLALYLGGLYLWSFIRGVSWPERSVS